MGHLPACLVLRVRGRWRLASQVWPGSSGDWPVAVSHRRGPWNRPFDHCRLLRAALAGGAGSSTSCSFRSVWRASWWPWSRPVPYGPVTTGLLDPFKGPRRNRLSPGTVAHRDRQRAGVPDGARLRSPEQNYLPEGSRPSSRSSAVGGGSPARLFLFVVLLITTLEYSIVKNKVGSSEAVALEQPSQSGVQAVINSGGGDGCRARPKRIACRSSAAGGTSWIPAAMSLGLLIRDRSHERRSRQKRRTLLFR